MALKNVRSTKHLQFQKNSRRLELSISKNTPHGRWGQGPGSVDPRFPAGLPFPVPEILEFVAFGASGNIFQQFPWTYPEFSLTTPEQAPETATALSSFLIVIHQFSSSPPTRKGQLCCFLVKWPKCEAAQLEPPDLRSTTTRPGCTHVRNSFALVQASRRNLRNVFIIGKSQRRGVKSCYRVPPPKPVLEASESGIRLYAPDPHIR